MKLIEYMLKYNIEPIQVACALKCSISSVYRYMAGKKMHLKRAKEVELFTEKNVKVEEIWNQRVKQR